MLSFAIGATCGFVSGVALAKWAWNAKLDEFKREVEGRMGAAEATPADEGITRSADETTA